MAVRKIIKKTTKKAAKKAVVKAKPPMKVEKPVRQALRPESQHRGAQGKPIGVVTHFYGNIKVAIVKFKKPVKSGSKLCFCGATTDFDQVVKSMQYDHKEIAVAPKGKEVGIKVNKRVREGDEVFLMN